MKCNKRKTAFSLVEISIVVLIIGIFIAGITTANYLYDKAILSTAQGLTKGSPIPSIKELGLWLETSTSLDHDNLKDGDAISLWSDLNLNGNRVDHVDAGSSSPTYANTINRVPAIRFSGDENSYFVRDASFLKKTNYSVVIVEQREASGDNNYFLGDPNSSATNQNLLLGYKSDGTIIHSQSGTNVVDNTSSYSGTIANYSPKNPKLFIFTSSSVEGKKLYLNGILIAQSSNTDPISNISNLYIGKGYDGQIGELAIFTKKLSDEEISQIANYMNKKWKIKVAPKGSSCIGGTVDSDNKCNNNCAVSITGSSVTTVGDGNGSVACNQSGYSGSVSYTCSNGTASTSGTCSAITCSVAAGTGYNSQSNLAYANSGSGSFSCDVAGYSGTKNYTCTTSGTATITGGTCSAITCSVAAATGYNSRSNLTYATSGSGSFSCDVAGYSGTKNYTCTTSGTATITGGTCTLQTCTISGITGLNSATVNYGTGSVSCNQSGYSGTISYNCGSGGSVTTTGSCSGSSTPAGGYYVQLSPFGSATYTNNATFQNWFATNGCANSAAGVGSSPGGYTFTNGSISTNPSGYVIWMSTSTTKYWKMSSWNSMFASTPDFAANIAAIGCMK